MKMVDSLIHPQDILMFIKKRMIYIYKSLEFEVPYFGDSPKIRMGI